MVNVENTIFVSNSNYEYGKQKILDLVKQNQTYFALSLNSRSKVYSFVPIQDVTIADYNGDVYEFVFENAYGKRYNLTVTPTCEFVTKRGLIPANKVNDLDVFIDERDLLCKVVAKRVVQMQSQFANVSIQYTNNYFCNGILIKGQV